MFLNMVNKHDDYHHIRANKGSWSRNRQTSLLVLTFLFLTTCLWYSYTRSTKLEITLNERTLERDVKTQEFEEIAMRFAEMRDRFQVSEYNQANAKRELSEVKDELKKKADDVIQKDQKLEELTNNINTMQISLDQKNEELEVKDNSMAELALQRQYMETDKNDKITELTNQKNELESQLAESSGKIEQYQKQLEEMRKENERLSQSVADATKVIMAGHPNEQDGQKVKVPAATEKTVEKGSEKSPEAEELIQPKGDQGDYELGDIPEDVDGETGMEYDDGDEEGIAGQEPPQLAINDAQDVVEIPNEINEVFEDLEMK